MDMISPSIAALTPSLTLKVTNRAKGYEAAGEEVYGLAGGEPEMDTPDNIKQAAITALNNGATKYTPFRRSARHSARPLPTSSRGKTIWNMIPARSPWRRRQHACFNAIMTTVSEETKSSSPPRTGSAIRKWSACAAAFPSSWKPRPENGWKLTAEQFEEAMTPRTKMVILTTPNNPTGAVYSEEELRALGEVALSEDILILADEIYEHLVYGDTRHVSIASLSPELYDLTITINGFSKGYAMTGWRMGYSAAPAPIAKAIQMIQDHTTSNVCTFAQYGGIEALTGDQSFISDMRDEYDMRRQYVLSRLNAIPNVSVVEPQGAFYFFVDTSKLGLTSLNLCDKLLERYKVAAVPGIAFGNDKAIRISYCTTLDILKEALDRFEEFCKAH